MAKTRKTEHQKGEVAKETEREIEGMIEERND